MQVLPLQELVNAYRAIHRLAESVGIGAWTEAPSLYAEIQRSSAVTSRSCNTGVKVFDAFQQDIWQTYERWCDLYLRCNRNAHPSQAKQVASAKAKAMADFTEIAIVFMEKMGWVI